MQKVEANTVNFGKFSRLQYGYKILRGKSILKVWNLHGKPQKSKT